MRKELRPVHDLVACDLCERTILKGERIDAFVAGGVRRKVCELCTHQALRAGWPRESALEDESLARERLGPRRSLWSRVVEWAEVQGLWAAPGAPSGAPRAERTPPRREHAPAATGATDEPDAPQASEGAVGEPAADSSPARSERSDDALGASGAGEARPRPDSEAEIASGERRSEGAPMARRPGRAQSGAALKDLIAGRRREPRRISAVPTSREGKLEQALELFNASEHPRTIAGIGRALGEPLVSAAPLRDTPAAGKVGITVAWELSWYRYRIDLEDSDQAVVLVDRGDEIEDLDEAARGWNAGADADGRLALVVESVS